MATPTSSAVPAVRTIHRVELEPGWSEGLPLKQVTWAGCLALAMGLGHLVDAVPYALDLVVGLGLGLAVFLTAAPRRVLGLGAFLALPVITVAVGGLLGTSSFLHSLGLQDSFVGYLGGIGAWQILAAGGAAGLAVVALGQPDVDRFQAVVGLLAGVALCGLGWWVSQRLLPGGLGSPAWSAATGGVLGLVTGQLLLLPGLRTRSTSRIPSPARIRATLEEAYREPCMNAWTTDQQVAKASPDQETRDGLGEVGAWIYKLQWTLQALDRQLAEQDPVALQERIAKTFEDAEDASDPFVRERRLATARHLEQLQAHLGELERERRRTEALREYASAFLEEARTGLALAHVTPGSHTPERLDDVLGRLRTYSDEREARRNTAHEVVRLA